MTFIQPLDLETIFINTLSGSLNIFIFLLLILIASLAAKFRMNNTSLLFFLAGFGVILSPLFSLGLFAFTIIIGGVGMVYLIIKFLKY